MAPGAKGVKSANEMKKAVGKLAKDIGLQVLFDVPAGVNYRAKRRTIDVLLSDPWATRGSSFPETRLGIACIFQDKTGTAKYKSDGFQVDIPLWPIDGVLVYDGDDLDKGDRAVMCSKGAVSLDKLEQYLRLYFKLPIIGGKTKL